MVKSFEDRLRINRFKKRKERQLVKASNKIIEKFEWDKVVAILTAALTEAIWREGGAHDDAVATAEIVYHAILRDLGLLFRNEGKVLPFKRNKNYFKKRVQS